MTKSQIIEVLRHHGFGSGRMISLSKSAYRRGFKDHFVIFNAKILTRRHLLASGADLDLTVDAAKLTVAAKEVGEDFFILPEFVPSAFWEPRGEPLDGVIANAVWWTRTQSVNRDFFLPIGKLRKKHGPRLNCTVGTWLGQPAYSVSCWENDAIYNQNLTGSAIDLIGIPRKEFIVKCAETAGKFSASPSQTPGRPIRPLLYQRAGPVEYVWFSNCFSVSAFLYLHTVAKLGCISFTIHRDVEAIHLRLGRKVIGLLWPNSFTPPHVAKSAQLQLRLMRKHDSARVQNIES